ncbi:MULTISPECIES: AIR synthase family protein [Haloferax]|nr:AIR synthase family protein [Haloferax mediterranei]AFK20197.2 hydrogenase expression/formation protein [Haloferax mediterranei ATCC 33500]AHZ23572.1 hydrogenase expression protein [Haloferax mediterranei ATCC 33500]MDX5987046.1 AIR synthase family protein [Haloferax mediterranei ATCC 33500]
MTDLGKVDRDFFDEYIYPRLGATRDDVALGPTHGVDFGLLDIDGTAVALATDPVSVLPALGFERAGQFAIDIVLSDIAVSGLDPSHLAISFTLPPEMTDAEFAELWAAMHDEAEDLGVSIVTGHTARYSDCSYPWVGGATALAVGDHDDVVRPDGARPGDDVLVTKGPAVETTGLLTTLFPDGFDGLGPDTLEIAQERLDETDAVRDAMTVSAAGGHGVHAMHDATECGVHGALNEIAGSAGVQLEIDESSIPFRPGVRDVCEYLDIDPWRSTTAGSLIVATDPEVTDDVISALNARGTPVGVAGTVVLGEGVVVDGKRIDHPDVDPSWGAYERLANEAEK